MSIPTGDDFSIPVPSHYFSERNVMHSIYKKIHFQFMYFKGKRYCAGGVFHMKPDPVAIISITTSLWKESLLEVHVWAVIDSFWLKNEKPQHVYVFVCDCVSVCFHDSERLAGNQATRALPLTPPLNPPTWSGLGSISNFLELISLQQEGGHCLICPKDIIKH